QRRGRRNQFIEYEADVGDGEDEDEEGQGGEGKSRANRRGRFGMSGGGSSSNDENDDDEDMDKDLSSFVVDDEQVEFYSQSNRDMGRDGDGLPEDEDGNAHTPRRIGDFYRQSLIGPTTPVTEIMQRLAERERQRRWVSDTPTRGSRPAVSNGLMLASSSSCENSEEGGLGASQDGSSDFERAEDLFTQAA
ncbi:hypothetical protein GGI12_004886, partial [Dipsacomyces acuminosporus]